MKANVSTFWCTRIWCTTSNILQMVQRSIIVEQAGSRTVGKSWRLVIQRKQYGAKVGNRIGCKRSNVLVQKYLVQCTTTKYSCTRTLLHCSEAIWRKSVKEVFVLAEYGAKVFVLQNMVKKFLFWADYGEKVFVLAEYGAKVFVLSRIWCKSFCFSGIWWKSFCFEQNMVKKFYFSGIWCKSFCFSGIWWKSFCFSRIWWKSFCFSEIWWKIFCF